MGRRLGIAPAIPSVIALSLSRHFLCHHLSEGLLFEFHTPFSTISFEFLSKPFIFLSCQTDVVHAKLFLDTIPGESRR